MKHKPFLAVLLAASLAGLTGLFIKHMSIPATSIAWVRTAVPTVLLGSIFLAQRRKIFREKVGPMLVASVLNVGRMYFFFVAFINTSIANATVMLFTWPVFVTILSALFLGERIRPKQVALLVVAMGGIVLIYAQDISFSGADFVGMSAALAAALFYSITVIIFKSAGNSYGRFETIFYQNLVGSLFFLPFFLTSSIVPTQLDWILTISHALFLGTLAFSFFFYGLQHMRASRTSTIAYVEIVVALSTGVLIMGEEPSPQMLFGGALILLSTFLLSRLGTDS
ncbi:MAG: DMT family transporter [Saprospiraceae bacterium]|nr:DMT family transporter [Saprospiraceae bacterium]